MVERTNGSCIVTSRRGSITVDPQLFQVLGEDQRYRQGSEIIASLAGPNADETGRARIGQLVTTLVRQRLLDVVGVPGHEADQREIASP
jgi:hypothetical protein